MTGPLEGTEQMSMPLTSCPCIVSERSLEGQETVSLKTKIPSVLQLYLVFSQCGIREIRVDKKVDNGSKPFAWPSPPTALVRE